MRFMLQRAAVEEGVVAGGGVAWYVQQLHLMAYVVRMTIKLWY